MEKDLKHLIEIVGTFCFVTGFMGVILFGLKGIFLWILVFGALTYFGLGAMLFIYLKHDEDYL